jgi:hypothetical protein
MGVLIFDKARIQQKKNFKGSIHIYPWARKEETIGKKYLVLLISSSDL